MCMDKSQEMDRENKAIVSTQYFNHKTMDT